MPHLKFKRHYKLIVLLAVLLAVLVVGAGNQPIVAYSVDGLAHVAGQVTGPATASAMPIDAATATLQISGSIWSSSAVSSQ